jgi:hypothetical protein
MQTQTFLAALLFVAFSFTAGLAQKVLQIEKYGRPETQKIHIGSTIAYRLKGQEGFRLGYIEDFRVADSLIVLGDRYLNISEIGALRFERGWPDKIGGGLMVFGGSWSGFAAVGFATDGDPETNYRWSDAIVSLTSIGLGYGIAKLFKYKTVNLNKRRWLRLLDLNFKKPD